MKRTNPHRCLWATLATLLFALACPQAWAADAPATTPAALDKPDFWCQAAIEEVVAHPAETMASYDWRQALTQSVLRIQATSGNAAGALALAQRLAPSALGEVAAAQARTGDVRGALATVKLIPDEKAKSDALLGMTDALTRNKSLAEARKVLDGRPKDDSTANLYANLAAAQAHAGDTAGALASIKAIADAPDEGGFNAYRRATAHVDLAAALARAGDRQGYLDNLATAKQLAKDLSSTYERNTLLKIARVQADAGDYDAATATLEPLKPQQRLDFADGVLAAKVRRGEVKPAEALAKVTGYSLVYDAAIDVQMAAKDYRGAAQTLAVNQGQSAMYSDYLLRIADGFLSAGDIDGAIEYAKGLQDHQAPTRVPGGRAQVYGHLAGKRAAAGDKAGYAKLIALAVESALQVVDPRPDSNMAFTRKHQVLGNLARVQEDAGDFEGAAKTIGQIEVQADKRAFEVECQARGLAAAGKLREAQDWIRGLPDVQERARAYTYVAGQLASAKKG